jgi:Ca2+-binding RTX toxin-like protein
MPTLTVAATTRYDLAPNNALVNGQNITAITFNSPLNTAVSAFFSSTQFGGANISNSVTVTGGQGRDQIEVFVASGAVFSAAGWTLINWSVSDRHFFEGTGGAESITGTAFGDDFQGRTGADTLRGGDGDDAFFYDGVAGLAPAGEIIDGGVGTDSIFIVAGNNDLTAATFTSIERLEFGGTNGSATLTAAQANGLTQIEGSSGAQAVIINTASNVDLSDIAFTNWTSGTDTITIDILDVNSSTFTGSSQNDTISALGSINAGTLTIRGGGGRDTLTGGRFSTSVNVFVYNNSSEIEPGEIINGRGGSNTIRLGGTGAYDFSTATLITIDTVNFEGSGVKTAIFNSSQFGTGLSTSLLYDGSATADTLEIRMDTLSFSAAAFTSANFTSGSDILSIIGTASGDSITTASFDSRVTGGAGQDFITGGAGNDTFVYTALSEFVAGESILGAGGTDTLAITANADFNFSSLGGSGVERVLFETSGPASITVNSGSAGLNYTSLAIDAISTQAMTFTVNQIGLLFSAAAWTLDAEFTTGGTIVLNGTVGPVGNKSITGSAGRDSITGSSLNDTLIGGNGNDTLTGGAGADSINGGAGFDVIKLFQGESSDSVDGGTEADVLDLSGLTSDTAIVNLTTNLWSTSRDSTSRTIINIEGVRGGGGNDSITGAALETTFTGGGGADTLTGGASSDRFIFNTGDVVAGEVINGGGGTGDKLIIFDGIVDFTQATLSNVEFLELAGSGTVTLRGSQLGASGSGQISSWNFSGPFSGPGITPVINIIEASSINTSNFSFNSQNANPTCNVTGTSGADTISNTGGGSSIRGRLDGAAGNDTITGNGTLVGGDGDDRLVGGGGSDALIGDGGVDTGVFSGARSTYATAKNAGVLFIKDLSSPFGGLDQALGVERFQFAGGVTLSAEAFTPVNFNGDLNSDILWVNTAGQAVNFLMDGTTIIGANAIGAANGASWTVRAVGDLNGDGSSDMIWQETTGLVVTYLMNGSSIASATVVDNPGAAFRVVGSGDLNGDGNSDIVLQDGNGQAVVWFMNGSTIASAAAIGPANGADWSVAAVGDLNGDGRADLVWENIDGTTVGYLMNGSTITSAAVIAGANGTAFSVKGMGDLNGDGRSDIIWQFSNGQGGAWLMNSTTITTASFIGGVNGSQFEIRDVADISGDGLMDLVWQNTTNGQAAGFIMNGTSITSAGFIGGANGADFFIV